MKNKSGGTTGQPDASNYETSGGVKFELVGVPDCMDEAKNLAANSIDQPQTMGDVMVFDFSAGKKKQNKGPSGKKRPQWGEKTMTADEEQKIEEVLVSTKDRQRIMDRDAIAAQALPGRS